MQPHLANDRTQSLQGNLDASSTSPEKSGREALGSGATDDYVLLIPRWGAQHALLELRG
jgi:hypothetical protein